MTFVITTGNVWRLGQFFRFLCAIMLFFFMQKLKAEARLDMPESLTRIDAAPFLEYYQNPLSKLTIEDVVGAAEHFKSGPSNFGVGKRDLWVRLKIANPWPASKEIRLEMVTPTLDLIHFYESVASGAAVLKWKTGDSLAFKSRPLNTKTFVFPAVIGPFSESIFYIRIQTGGLVDVSTYVWSMQSFGERESSEQIVNGVFYGILLALLLYNLGLGFSTKERIYFSYSLFVLVSLLFYASWIGSAFQFLWPNSPAWANVASAVLLSQIAFWASLFVYDFLDVPSHLPKLARFIRLTMLLPWLAMAASPILTYPAYLVISMVYTSLMCVVGVGIGIVSMLSGQRAAVYFLLAFSALMGAAFVSIVSASGLLFVDKVPHLVSQIGCALEVLLLSFGLGDKINQSKKDRFAALFKLRNNLEILFNTTQNIAKAKSPRHMGLVTVEALFEQISSLRMASFHLMIPKHKGSLTLFKLFEFGKECSNNDSASIEADLVKLPELLAGTKNQLLLGDTLVTRTSKTQQGFAYLVVRSPQAQYLISEDLKFVEALCSVLGVALDNILHLSNLEDLVVARTEDLSQALAIAHGEKSKIEFLLENMNLGLVIFDSSFQIEPQFSRFVTELFALESAEIASSQILSLIFSRSNESSNTVDQLTQILKICFDQSSLCWELNEANLLQDVVIEVRGEKKYLAIDWRPLFDENACLKKVMVCIRDVTQQVVFKEAVAQQSLAHERMMKALGELVMLRRENSRRSLVELRRRMVVLSEAGHESWDSQLVAIEIHTMKGIARMSGLSGIVNAAHLIEGKLKEASAVSLTGKVAFSAAIADLSQEIAYYYEVFTQILHDADGAGDAIHSTAEANTLFAAVDRFIPTMKQALATEDLALGSIRLTDAFNEWSEAGINSIADALLHALNNAVDHGYVIPARTRPDWSRGPADFAISVERSDESVIVRIADQGAGINFNAIRQKLEKNRSATAITSDEDLLKILLQGGISTADQVTISSGRAVGIAAVNSIVKKLGGTVVLGKNEPHGTLLTLTVPIVAVHAHITESAV